MNPAIRTSLGWHELSGLWTDQIDELMEGAQDWRDVPPFVRAMGSDAVCDYVDGIDECLLVHMPEEIFVRLCQEHQVVIAPGRICLFGDGRVSSDADIARAWAEVTEEEIEDFAERGRELREEEGCIVVGGIVAQYI
jgi:hypothetical protein